VRFRELELSGAFVIDLERHDDERGFFARSFCEREFEDHGLPPRFPQSNVSWNRERLTLRGMHYAAAPQREAKLVRCTAGAIHDVIVDLRAGSRTRFAWAGVELDAENRRALFVPEGFAHGFLTLSAGAEVLYQMGRSFVAGSARGFRFDDARFGIRWPWPPAVISERDRTYPDFDEERFDG
jgi:dTDP-4-dehydrorhamnose 3,5-epimerase